MSTGSLLMITGKTTGKAKGTNAGKPKTGMSTEEIGYSLKTTGDMTTEDGREVRRVIVDDYREYHWEEHQREN